MKIETILILGLGLLAYLFFKENGIGEKRLTQREQKGIKEGLIVV